MRTDCGTLLQWDYEVAFKPGKHPPHSESANDICPVIGTGLAKLIQQQSIETQSVDLGLVDTVHCSDAAAAAKMKKDREAKEEARLSPSPLPRSHLIPPLCHGHRGCATFLWGSILVLNQFSENDVRYSADSDLRVF